MIISHRDCMTLAIACATLFGAAVACAQSTQPTTMLSRRPLSADDRRFELTPAPADGQSSAYFLVSDPAQRIDANAATLYLQAMPGLGDSADNEKLYSIDEIESDDAFAATVAEKVPWLDTSVPFMLTDAARAARVDWGLPVRARTFDVLMPHLNEARALAKLVSFKARLATGKGDATAAIALIAAGSALADRLDDGETFTVSEVFAVGIQTQNMERVARVVQLSNCPNLYWSLRQLPQPFGNVRSAVETELAQLSWTFPKLAAGPTDLTNAEWENLLTEVRARLAGSFSGLGLGDDRLARLTDPARIRAGDDAILPVARDHYVRTRRVTPESIKQIESPRLVAIYQWESYRALTNEQGRLFALPYAQMLPRLREIDDRIRVASDAQPSNPFLLVAPSLYRFATTNALLDRTIAALTCVEAIRAYAAAHDGNLPPSLDAIVDTPPPVNPVDGQPFDYALNADGSATLSDSGELIERALTYTIRVRR